MLYAVVGEFDKRSLCDTLVTQDVAIPYHPEQKKNYWLGMRSLQSFNAGPSESLPLMCVKQTFRDKKLVTFDSDNLQKSRGIWVSRV